MVESLDRRPTHKKINGLGAFGTSLLLTAACTPSAPSPTQNENQTPNPTTRATEVLGVNTGPHHLLYPIENGYYLGGPHSDGLSSGVKYAVDFGAKEVVRCPGGSPLENTDVVASESGKIIRVGNDNDPNDPFHSIVEVQGEGGHIVGYMHLDNISVNVGDQVETSDPLGILSCEVPPGGQTSGIHVHEYIKDKNGNALPIEGVLFYSQHDISQGFEVRALPRNYDGLLVRGEDVRTADTRRCGPEEPSIENCGGIRNDLFSEPIAAEQTPDPGIDTYFEQYLSPENANTDQRFAAKGLRFWLETFLTKQEAVEIYDGTFLQIDTDTEEWASEIPFILNNEFGQGWPYYTPESQAIFNYHWRMTGEKEGEGEVEIRNVKLLAYGTSDFGEVDLANDWERFESVAIKYLSRYRYFDQSKNKWTDWTEWDDVTEREGRDYYSYRIKAGNEGMYCISCTGELYSGNAKWWSPTNSSDNPRQELPYLGYYP